MEGRQHALQTGSCRLLATWPVTSTHWLTWLHRLSWPLSRSLIGVSVVQSVASAVLAPSLRHVADMLALSWRAGLTRSAFAKYLVGKWTGCGVRCARTRMYDVVAVLSCTSCTKEGLVPPSPPPTPPTPAPLGNTFYTTSQLAGMTDVDQRLTRDIGAHRSCCCHSDVSSTLPRTAAEARLHNRPTRGPCIRPAAERLCDDLAALIPTLVKPLVDIGWFSWQLWRLTGRRGMAILYLYTLFGWGSLR